MPDNVGLQTDPLTWVLVALLAGGWLLSVRITPGWNRDGWPSILKSLYGYLWLAFGVDILWRFLMLTYNAVEWGNGTLRLAVEPPSTINRTLCYCGLFWLLVVAAYALAVRRQRRGPLELAYTIPVRFAFSAAIPTTLFASVIFFQTEGSSSVPIALLTPLALLASLYMIPATVIWLEHFRRPGPKWRLGSVQLLVLLPALVRGWRSPYRENLAPLLLIPLIAALFAGRKPALRTLLPAVLAGFLGLSLLIGSYRKIKWENVREAEVARELIDTSVSDFATTILDEPLRRFHAFDSMLLTVSLVPSAQPFSGKNVLLSPFVRGLIPRVIYDSKGAADAGTRFGESIWAFDNPEARERSSAAIAPSMPGDLFSAGGVLFIALGALIWGSIIGLLDGWKSHLAVFTNAGLTVLLASQCAMSVERDFDNTVATLIQTMLAFIVVVCVLRFSQRGFLLRPKAEAKNHRNIYSEGSFLHDIES
ncbi:MAG: hypothetical protein ABSD53_17565 [Terriglobales bacterium]|jgi:hypothetical protein